MPEISIHFMTAVCTRFFFSRFLFLCWPFRSLFHFSSSLAFSFLFFFSAAILQNVQNLYAKRKILGYPVALHLLNIYGAAPVCSSVFYVEKNWWRAERWWEEVWRVTGWSLANSRNDTNTFYWKFSTGPSIIFRRRYLEPCEATREKMAPTRGKRWEKMKDWEPKGKKSSENGGKKVVVEKYLIKIY